MDIDDFSNFIDEDAFFEDEVDDEDIILTEEKDVIINKVRDTKITPPIMFNYEKVNIISQRIKQLDNNYKTTMPEEIKKNNLNRSFDIAMFEFNNKKLPPLFVIRPFPDGSYEKWAIDEFEEFP